MNEPPEQRKLNICLVIGSQYPPYPHGGVGSFAIDLAEGVAKRGHKITCISFYPSQVLHSNTSQTEMIDGVKVVRVPKPYENRPPRLQAVLEKFYITRLIRDLHRQDPFDLIEGEDGGGRLALGKLPDIPKIIRLHATTIYNDYVLQRKPSRLNHLFENIWIRRADFIVAVSDYVGRTTLMLTKLDKKKKYEIIHYAIDTDLFSPDPSIAIEPGLIVFTGVVAPRKGVLELIQAMNIVFAKNAKAKLWIIGDDKYMEQGTGYSGQVIQQLNRGLEDRVVFMGSKSRRELPSLLQQAEVCCFPSHVETFGIGITEAMAMEKPVVYMQTGPGPEVVEDQVSGLLCDTWNPQDIAEKIQLLLDHKDIARKMGVKARQRVVNKFEKEIWIERNLAYYQGCVSQYKSNRKDQES